MADLRSGRAGAAEQLVEAFYPDLKRIAIHRMKAEAPGHTLQPTALVNELYLELRKIRQLPSGEQGYAKDEQTAFLALAAHLMKRLLIHHARPLAKQAERLPLEAAPELTAPGEQTLREVESALNGLEGVDPRLRRVVEMKIYEGRSMREIADTLGCDTRTVDRYWSVARGWLRDHFDVDQS